MTPQEAIAIQTFRRPPLVRRFFYALFGWGWAVAFLLALLLTGCSADHFGEWRESDNLIAIQQEQQAQASREWAGQQVCGPAALAQWEGDTLSCHPRRGKSYEVAGVQP